MLSDPVADEGYHSRAVAVDLEECPMADLIDEPEPKDVFRWRGDPLFGTRCTTTGTACRRGSAR